MTNEKVQISIVIPTIHREKSLEQTLLGLKNQKQVVFEVLVIYQSPLTHLKSEDYPVNFYFLHSNKQSASAARNIGILNSKSEILLFIDDDVLINDDYFVYKHLRHYGNKQLPGVVGRSKEKSINKTTYLRPKRSFNNNIGFFYSSKDYGVSTFLQTGRSNNLSVRKEFAIKVGGMDENYSRGAHREETDFCLRISRQFGKFIYDPNSVVTHLNEFSGGIRSWNDSNYIKAKHHMVGAIYFGLKMAPLRYRHEYFFTTLRYLVCNKTILLRPRLYAKVIVRFISSYITAVKLVTSGPIYLN